VCALSFQLLVGEESEITANILSSDDLDTPPEELVYSIEKPSNGIVAFKVSPDDSVDSFTQAQINNGEVLFTHSGGLTSISLNSLKNRIKYQLLQRKHRSSEDGPEKRLRDMLAIM